MNKIIQGNAYELIKTIPDKSIDLVYTDIPYDMEGNGDCAFGSKKRNYHKEYSKICENTEAVSDVAKRVGKTFDEISEISFGIDYSILDEMVRVCKKNIRLYMVQ